MKILIVAILLSSTNLILASSNYVNYQADLSPLKLVQIDKGAKLTSLNVEDSDGRFKFRTDLKHTQAALGNNTLWLDGYWIGSSQAFQLASTMNKEDDHDEA